MKIYAYRGKKNICGEQVRELRRAMGITQTTLAARLHRCDVWLDQKAISRIELHDRVVTDYELWALATVLQVDVRDLMPPMPIVEFTEDAERSARIAAVKLKLERAKEEYLASEEIIKKTTNQEDQPQMEPGENEEVQVETEAKTEM